MKKRLFITTLALLAAATTTTLAQFKRGSFLVGGTIAFSQENNEITRDGTDFSDPIKQTGKTTTVQIAPTASYFIIDRLAIGIITPYTFYKSTAQNGYYSMDSRSSSYMGGPQVRYYFPLNEKFSLFPEVSYAWGAGNSKSALTEIGTGNDLGSDVNVDTKNRQLKAGAGASYFVGSGVALTITLLYSRIDAEADYSEPFFGNTINQTTNSFNIALGLEFFLNKR